MTIRLPASPTPAGCVSDLKLDQWQAGELSAEAEATLGAHVAGCARCSQRRQQLSAEAERFLQQFPVAPRGSRDSRRGQRLALAATLLAAAAACLLWLEAPGSESGTRSKGPPHLTFFVKRAGEVTVGVAGQRVFAGDQLRFAVTSEKPQQLAILGRDSTGAAFVYHSTSGRSVAVDAGRDVALGTSIELDAAPGTEQIWGVFCDQPFEVAPLRATLAALGTVQSPSGCTIDRLTLEKGAPP
jgi:hypothetical protein